MSTMSTPAIASSDGRIFEDEIRHALEVRQGRRDRLAHVIRRAHAHELDVRVHRQPSHELRPCKPRATRGPPHGNDCCSRLAPHRSDHR